MRCTDENSISKNIGLPAEKLDLIAFNKYPRRGKCPKSTMMCGWHRVGSVPVYSVLDNGAPGCIVQEICLDCGKRFFGLNDSGFVILDQPRRIGERQP